MKLDPLGIIKPQKHPISKIDAFCIGIEVIEYIQKKELSLEETRQILYTAEELINMYLEFNRDQTYNSQIDIETLCRAYSRKMKEK